MSEKREFYGPTVDEAAARAAAELQIPASDVSYEVLDPGSSGFMGIGARDARILVDLPAGTAPPALDPEPMTEPDEVDVSPAAETEEDEPSPPPDPEEDFVHPAADEPPAEVLPPVPDEVLERVRSFTTASVEGMGIDARIDVYDAGEFIAVDVTSEQAGLFIGQKGETIDALQYLLNVAIHRDRAISKRAVLDSEGYRQRRIEALQGMAHRSARRAVRERRRVELPPMSPSERRIVHIYLQDNDSVSTESEGFGDERRVTISPR